MYGRATLASTGATVALFGTTDGFAWTIAAIVTLVFGGALIYRIAKRKARFQ